MSALEDGLRDLLALPRGRQARALERLLAGLPDAPVGERWNAAFGRGSLFEAWTRSGVASRVHEANANWLRPLLDARPGWRVIEVGAGNGELWRRLLQVGDRGELVAIDPSTEALEELARHVPADVVLDARLGRVESLGELPEADAVVCALTLHHVAGRDAAERERHGLPGDGKHEVLSAFRAALAPRAGILLLCEADVHCEIDLPPGDPLLRERLLDSYVRRCALSLLDDLERGDADEDLAERWRHVLRAWCMEQVGRAELPLAERDVYELDAGRWRDSLARAGFALRSSRCTDDYGLFYQHVAATPR